MMFIVVGFAFFAATLFMAIVFWSPLEAFLDQVTGFGPNRIAKRANDVRLEHFSAFCRARQITEKLSEIDDPDERQFLENQLVEAKRDVARAKRAWIAAKIDVELKYPPLASVWLPSEAKKNFEYRRDRIGETPDYFPALLSLEEHEVEYEAVKRAWEIKNGHPFHGRL